MRLKYQRLSSQDAKQEIIAELKRFQENEGFSPGRRDVPLLASYCYRHFGSFNVVKKEAGLLTKHTRIESFPQQAFEHDEDLAQIASYITFDGHLYNDLTGMMYSSKNLEDIYTFEKIITRKFNVPAHYRLYNTGSTRQTHMINFFNKQVCTYLFQNGIPKGDKVIQEFSVPSWISSSRELARNYLKIAFLCEGSMKENYRKNPRISFTHAKWNELFFSGLNFMNTLRDMLLLFNITTCKPYISGKRVRKKDGKLVSDLRFRIKTKDNHIFIREIGWLK